MKKMLHEDRYPLPVDDMFRVFTTRAFYEDRYSRSDGRYEFLHFGPRSGRFVVDVKQRMSLRAGSELPSFVRRFVREENVLHTVMEWDLQSTASGERHGVHRFHIDGVPVDVKGTMRMSPQAGGCINRIELNVHCAIPLIGGKIAALLAERAERSLSKNYESTCAWLRTQGLTKS